MPIRTRSPGTSHYVVQFASEPAADQLQQLRRRGANVVSCIPESALAVSMREGTDLSGLGIRWIGQLQPIQKFSPEYTERPVNGRAQSVLVEFYSDIPQNEARTIAIHSGAIIREHPDLLAHHLLIEATADQLRNLAAWDEVSYIFPASDDLLNGFPVHGCSGALTMAGPVGQAVPLVGDGWDGPGLGSASLNYAFVHLTGQAPADSVESEIERAYAEWAKYAQVTFTRSSDPTARQTLAVLFASGAHGDGHPFTGPGGVVAHTFYPYPVSREPIAGDQHFNNDESWRIGANLDVFSVALHETGHALGLGHSDNPRDVMYPYYRMVSGLGPGDIAALRQQYAAAALADNPSPPITPAPPPPTPFALTILPAPEITSESSIALRGTTAGGSGFIQVRWSTNQGASGVALGSGDWTIATIPLNAGANLITVTARDANQDQASQSVTVTYQPPLSDAPIGGNPPSNPPANPPTSPGGGADTVPPSITILSPAMTLASTSASSIVVSGTAQDTVGVAQVTWSSSTGGSGVATGTTSWSSGPIQLYVGTTTIVIYARDAAGNQAWRSLTVTRTQ